MDIRFKKTSELSDAEIEQMCQLFSSIFVPHRDSDTFRKQFLDTPLGYSYHALMIDGGRIVGAYSSVPQRYLFDGREMLFALSVDTMIAEEYRGDPWQVVRMAERVYDAARRDGIPFAFCFPNDNVYLLRKKLLRWRDIGALSYYVLPVSMSVKAPAMRCLDPVLRMGLKVFVGRNPASRDIQAESPIRFPIERMEDAAFVRTRFSFFHRYSDRGTGYTQVQTPHGYFVYRREMFAGIEAAFLVDVFPLSRSHMRYAVRRLYERERTSVAMLVYIGRLPFRPQGLFRLPKRMEPKRLDMTGRILIDNVLDDRIFDIDNWRVDLASYDAL